MSGASAFCLIAGAGNLGYAMATWQSDPTAWVNGLIGVLCLIMVGLRG